MATRREFIRKTTLASTALFVDFAKADTKKEPTTEIMEVNKPIVLSTWRFGLKANDAAWEVLKNNGHALDAVETGVLAIMAGPTVMVALLLMHVSWMNLQILVLWHVSNTLCIQYQ
jgi:N4-(beta-N-acetylglucosaminyl)-L-asparaginase